MDDDDIASRASTEGDLPALQTLLERRPDLLNAPVEPLYGRTPFMQAALSTQLECCRYLTTLPGLDLLFPAKNGSIAIMWAADGGQLDIIKLLTTIHNSGSGVDVGYVRGVFVFLPTHMPPPRPSPP